MEYRKLGRTNEKISEISFGGIPIMKVSEKQAVSAIKKAMDMGINLFDTARTYSRPPGNSENKIGKAMKGIRDKVFLSSRGRGVTAEEIRENLEDSLKALDTDYIDLYMYHDATAIGYGQKETVPEINKDNIEPIFDEGMVVEGLKRAQKEGKIRFIGISIHGSPWVQKRAIRSGEFDAMMVAYNLTNRPGDFAPTAKTPHVREDYSKTQKEIFPLAKEKGVGIMIMKSLGGGVLAQDSPALRRIAKGKSVSPVQIPLQWVLANQEISTVCVGMNSAKQVEEDVKAVEESAKISAEEMQMIMEDLARLGENFCRGCQYCLPCKSAGIIIPDVLRLMNYYKMYGLTDWAKEQYGKLSVKPDECVECEECEKRCPYHLPIRELVKEAVKIFG